MHKPSLPLNIKGSRSGYSLVEVMIAVTLTLVLMYAIAAIFGRVSSIMSRTQDVLSMTNNLRATKDRLVADLENLTVPQLKAPTSKYGFFSYSEGKGNAFDQLSYSMFNDSDGKNICGVPQNSRRFTTYGNFDHRNVTRDTTVGDTDDILSFTVRAPQGQWFRGRAFKENADLNAAIDDNIEIIESEYAEVIWFLRGTTLYRRVLLIIPDETLQKRLVSLEGYFNSNIDGEALLPRPSGGYGFYRFFDVSVHLDPNVKANTLHDLANRANRYGYWASPVVNKNSLDNTGSNPVSSPIFDLSLHGRYGAWYWLRMPTQQESALNHLALDNVYKFFRAGVPFGSVEPFASQTEMGDTLQNVPFAPLDFWPGSHLLLGLANRGPDINKNEALTSFNLPNDFFIDNWRMANPWFQQVQYSGQLNLAGVNDGTVKELNADVILTNVLSFDVKVWNPASSEFVDLGDSALYDNAGNVTDYFTDPFDFRSEGNYGIYAVRDLPYTKPLRNPETNQVLAAGYYNYYRPVMPAVFDTWTEEYEKEFLAQSWTDALGNEIFGATSKPDYQLGDIPLDDSITASDLPDYPPPYEAEIKVLRIEIRAFDPVSRTIKNSTVEVKIP